MKPKKCAICRETYQPRATFQKTCSPRCALAYVKANKEKRERKELKEAKEKLKTRRDYIKEAQIAFNSFIRQRDQGKPCICCGKPLANEGVGGGFDCGHYRSVGSAPHLRFDERNAHGQTKQCNRYGAGRAVDYRIGLINRIGLESVEALEADQTPRHYTIDELKAIKANYKEKIKELKQNG